MKGRKPSEYKVRDADWRYWQAIVRQGQLPQRVTNRARVLLALARGERIVEIVRWLGVGRMTIWELWQRYQQRGVEALWDAERSGRPVVFPPLQRVQLERVACTEPSAYGLHLTHWDCRSLARVVVEPAVVDAIHYTTVARILAAASLQPHRSRYWKTATIDEQFTSLAAKILWCYERVEWLYQRGEVVICLDEKPNIQALSRGGLKQPMGRGRIERREFEYKRHGTVTLLVALNVYDGKMWGCCLDANDHDHFLWGVRQVARRYRTARRIHVIMDKGPSHIDHHTQAYFAAHPRLRSLYTPPHASWLNQAELLLRAFSDKYLHRFDCESRQQLIDHLKASWLEYNRSFAHPFSWSWTRRHMYEWAERKGTTICTKTFATVH